MEKEVFYIHKRKGISPLDAVLEFKKRKPEYEEVKMAYAGRLDPMAEGVLLMIAGNELKNFDDYLKLNKKYEATLLFGFHTDTYDILGIPKKGKGALSEKNIKKTLLSFEGKFSFLLPPFSSYKIKGKPLFKWALEKRLKEIRIPEREVDIYNLQVNKIEKTSSDILEKEILESLEKVEGDFRQEEIKKEWRRLFQERDCFWEAKITVSCSSGTYIRSLAHEAGRIIGPGAVLLNLKRVEIGDGKVCFL